MKLNHVEIVGAGPAGLYTSILLRRAMPKAKIVVHEQNAKNATFGFGVVFSDKALEFLQVDDPQTHQLITPHMEHWQNMELNYHGETVILDGIGFSSISRLKLLHILQEKALKENVILKHEAPVNSMDELTADLIVGADGFNSIIRNSNPEGFSASLSHFQNQFAWFGTSYPYDTLTQTFLKTECGALNAHHYRYSPSLSTFIVECEPSAYQALGFSEKNELQYAKICEQIFSSSLRSASLLTNNSVWRRFPKLWCERWHHQNQVLIGDAVRTAHFSIGSGTRLALEDAIALVKSLQENDSLENAFQSYETRRKPIAKKIVTAANESGTWYDNFADKLDQSPLNFAFDYVTRSGRVDLERLRKLTPQFMKAYERQSESN